MEHTPASPLPMKAVLISSPQHPLGTLYYVWKQSRSNRELPTPGQIEAIMKQGTGLPCGAIQFDSMVHWMAQLGFNDPSPETNFQACRKHIRDELKMILKEGIPVVENLHFVFHLQNIPISLREQLVRHRIGTAIDPRVGVDIIPTQVPLRVAVQEAVQAVIGEFPPGSLMDMQVVPDLAESTWWSQTSRVVPFDTFFDEGRYFLPESLAGKRVLGLYGECDAEELYLDALSRIQEAYKLLMEAGVHIEDCRQLIPLAATHSITWTLNLKAMLHIFGKRSSWIAQVGMWGEVMGKMVNELVTKVHPMFRMLLLPQCIKDGKYVGCPVAGTNAERIAGTDGMPPCPLWVMYETGSALRAAADADHGRFPTVAQAAWRPPLEADGLREDGEAAKKLENWSTTEPVQLEMLNRNAGKYSYLWGFDVLEGIPRGLGDV